MKIIVNESFQDFSDNCRDQDLCTGECKHQIYSNNSVNCTEDLCPRLDKSEPLVEVVPELIPAYQKAVNHIDDFLEYRYKTCTQDEMKRVIMSHIDQIAKDIGVKMPLYTDEEICGDCLYAIKCSKCGHFEACDIGEVPNYIRGTCLKKKVDQI